jgi:hypothetical protein
MFVIKISIVLSYTFILRKQLHFIAFNLKIIGHENPDNNLGSLCIYSQHMGEIICTKVGSTHCFRDFNV